MGLPLGPVGTSLTPGLFLCKKGRHTQPASSAFIQSNVERKAPNLRLTPCHPTPGPSANTLTSWHICHSRPPCADAPLPPGPTVCARVTLGVVHSVDLHRGATTGPLCSRVMQGTPTAPKTLCSLFKESNAVTAHSLQCRRGRTRGSAKNQFRCVSSALGPPPGSGSGSGTTWGWLCRQVASTEEAAACWSHPFPQLPSPSQAQLAGLDQRCGQPGQSLHQTAAPDAAPSPGVSLHPSASGRAEWGPWAGHRRPARRGEEHSREGPNALGRVPDVPHLDVGGGH